MSSETENAITEKLLANKVRIRENASKKSVIGETYFEAF